MNTKSLLELQNVTRRFGTLTVLDSVNVTVQEGSFTALLGSSGCGKSTTLRIMAGLDRPTEGKVLLNNAEVGEKTAYERNVAMVFQSYALYPHLSVFQNIALPLTMRHLTALGRIPLLGKAVPGSSEARALIHKKVSETAESLGLEQLLDRKPSQLSGGQKQRVALGRALVRDPELFLLDEPLSNLDARLRVKMRGELVSLHKRTGRPFVYVTHDQTEAMAMADQIIVMMSGKVAQAGSPRELYQTPADMDVAAFIGHNSINFFDPEDDVGSLLRGDGQVLGIRPEHLSPDPEGQMSAHLETVEYLGSETVLGLRTSNGKEITAIAPGDAELPAIGSEMRLGASGGQLHHFDQKTRKRITDVPEGTGNSQNITEIAVGAGS